MCYLAALWTYRFARRIQKKVIWWIPLRWAPLTNHPASSSCTKASTTRWHAYINVVVLVFPCVTNLLNKLSQKTSDLNLPTETKKSKQNSKSLTLIAKCACQKNHDIIKHGSYSPLKLCHCLCDSSLFCLYLIDGVNTSTNVSSLYSSAWCPNQEQLAMANHF